MTRPGSWTRGLQAGQASLEMDDALIALALAVREMHFNISAQAAAAFWTPAILRRAEELLT